MLRHNLAAGGGAVVAGGNLTLVVIVAVIALLALAVAGWLVKGSTCTPFFNMLVCPRVEGFNHRII